MSERLLDWPGCVNARDFGGMRTRDGRVVRRGAIARSGALDRIPEGYPTVIDLRNDDERGPGLESLHVPLDGIEDRSFWDDWVDRAEFGTPFYYRAFLEHFRGRAAGVIGAIAEDYALSIEHLPPEPELAAVYERRGTTPQQAVLDLLDEIDVHEFLEGVDLEALRRRALAP